MTTKTNAKRPRGRPEVAPEQRLIAGSIRLTRAQWVKFAALGDGEWLRKKIDRAAQPEPEKKATDNRIHPRVAKRMAAKAAKTNKKQQEI